MLDLLAVILLTYSILIPIAFIESNQLNILGKLKRQLDQDLNDSSQICQERKVNSLTLLICKDRLNKDSTYIKGFSLLEILITLSVVSVISLSLVKAFLSSAKTSITLSNFNNESYISLKTFQHFKKIARDIDSYYLDQMYKIHDKGAVLFADGSQNAIMQSKDQTPELNSNAITVVRLKSNNLLGVKELIKNGTVYSLKACLTNENENLQINDIRNYLAISSDGIFETIGNLSTIGKTCASGEIQSTKSMLWRNSDSITIAILIPIESLYTIYLNSRRELRLLGHAGEKNIENQPLLMGISTVNIIEKLYQNIFPQFAVKILFLTDKDYQFTVQTHLARTTFLQPLFTL